MPELYVGVYTRLHLFELERFGNVIDRAARAHALFNRGEIGFVRLREIGRKARNLDALLRHLPEVLTHSREGEGTWSVTEGMAHLCHGERTDWLPRVQIIFRAADSETFPAFERALSGEPRGSPLFCVYRSHPAESSARPGC